MTTEKFECTACGKCCSKTPHFILNEMIDNSDNFIFQLEHHAKISTELNVLPKELIEHYERLGHTIMVPEHISSIYYFLTFTSVEYQGKCSKLDTNNKCSIYQNRPFFCQIEPINPYLPEGKQEEPIRFFKDKTMAQNWGCNFNDANRKIWENGLISDLNTRAIYNHYIEETSLYTDYYLNFLKTAGNNHLTEHLKVIYEVAKQNSTLLSDMNVALQVAMYYEVISPQQAEIFVKNQIQLIQTRIKEAKIRKNKDDRDITGLIEKQMNEYEKALKANIYKEQDSFSII